MTLNQEYHDVLMFRPLRIEYEDAWYHVMNRGMRREEVFTCKKDYKVFVELLQETAEKWNLRIFSYCLMPIEMSTEN